MPPVRRLLAIATGLLLTGALSLVPSLAVPASASSSSYLCTGYSACAKAGYSSSGYAGANKSMYWRMYGGHNCTNYAAFRMIQGGYSATRPWSSGSGSAFNWGVAMKSITNTTPAVGAVAWWPANAPGAGSSGHVAYVERVVSSSEIIISEDMWGGDFHWRDIKVGDRWPKGFVHFNDLELTSTDRPVISGTPQVGIPLSATTGTWPVSPTSYVYQWRANGHPIDGATDETFTPAPAQAGARISVRVTGGRSGFSPGYSYSHRGTPVAPGRLSQTSAPGITGTSIAGETLTAQPGQWSPTPKDQSIQWYADGQPIAGAAGPTLVLGPAQVDAQVSLRVTATLAGYTTTSASSAAVGPVLAGRVTVTSPFTIAGSSRVGQTLKVTPGSFTPSTATVAYQWRRGTKSIPGATGSTHRVTAADLGSRLTVRMTLSDPRYVGTARVLKTPAATTTRSTVTFSAVGKVRHAVVKVRVRAPGVARPTGTVTVKVGMRSVTGHLVKGRFTAHVAGLTHGSRKLRVYYRGAGSVEKASAHGHVRLPTR